MIMPKSSLTIGNGFIMRIIGYDSYPILELSDKGSYSGIICPRSKQQSLPFSGL